MTMVAARSAGRGLSTQDIESIRTQLAAGRRPKVVFTDSAGQIAGQTGQVIELTDPDGSEDFVVVRFGRDELPFSPADLAIPPRGAAARAKATQPAKATQKQAATPAAKPAPEFKLTEPPVPTPREEEPTMPRSTVDGSEPVPAAKPRKAAKQARPKSPAALTVTLSYADGEWTVAATQGSKSLAKPYLIKPAEALKMVALLDVAGVQEAVEQIVAAERSEVEQQAQRLRAELAEVEAKLAELTELH